MSMVYSSSVATVRGTRAAFLHALVAVTGAALRGYP